jgi:hypothetical protein
MTSSVGVNLITRGWGGSYRLRGSDGFGRITWRSTQGRFGARQYALDLMREIEP